MTESNTIQLGNTDVTNVKTSGTITAGAVIYPKTDGTNGQFLKTDGSGNLSWVTGSGGGGPGSGSDKRIKKNIEETDLGLDFITRLRPVRYNWVNPADYPPELLDERFKNKDNKATRPKDDPRFYDGLIAQEVEETLNTLNKKWSGHNIEKNAGKKQSLVYSSLVMPLIKSVQQLNNRLITQESEIIELKKIIQELKK